MSNLWRILVYLHSLLIFNFSWAAHPLITDDAVTIGRGAVQLEFTGELGYYREIGSAIYSAEIPVVFTYGINENLDVVFSSSYYMESSNGPYNLSSPRGILDSSVELKWLVYQDTGYFLALKPGFTLPTGDENRQLGVGKVTYGFYLAGTRQIENWWFHLNLGYTKNTNVTGERAHLWHVSLASEHELSNDLRVVANLGLSRHPEPEVHSTPGFILGGLIYSLSKGIDLDFGIKACLNGGAPDRSLLAGITWLF